MARKPAAASRMRAPKSASPCACTARATATASCSPFAARPTQPVYVLIDCGYKPGSNGPDYQLGTIDDVVDDIMRRPAGASIS